jgi:O-antigen/teichoic acid export membrane protein
VTVLPLCVGLAVFARPAVHLVFGSGYAESVGLLRVLMLAGALCLVSALLALVLMSAGVVRTMVAVNLVSLAVNVIGNLVLVPRDGVAASAWLTVVSELIVIAYGVVALRRRLNFGIVLARSVTALTVTVAAGAVGLALGPSSALSLAAAVAVFVAGLTLLRAWPPELTPALVRSGS